MLFIKVHLSTKNVPTRYSFTHTGVAGYYGEGDVCDVSTSEMDSAELLHRMITNFVRETLNSPATASPASHLDILENSLNGLFQPNVP